MDATKLIRIISKDLEELKTLTSEITNTENESALIVDLALSRAKLLCQEIELLKEITVKPIVQVVETANDIEEDEDEISETIISEPELEIINFEVQEFEEKVELANEEEEELEEDVVYNSEEDEEEISEVVTEEEIDEDDSTEEDEDEENDELIEENYISPEDIELEVEDKRNVEENESEEDESNEDFEDEEEIEDEEDEIVEEDELADIDEIVEEDEIEIDDQEDIQKQKSRIEVNELNPVQHAGIREIQIEDLDEDESESIQFTPVSKPAERPVMREIPKPEILIEEEKPEDDNSPKERSLNEVISENKSAETTLGFSPISSLKSSIGLNDRFLFIREIFSNNTDKYNMVIDHLDKLETIQQAVDYLKANLTLQKNDTSLKFVDLLKRRFTK